MATLKETHTDCDYCVHAWTKRSTRWEPEDSGCDLEQEMTQDECDLAEVGKCPYFSLMGKKHFNV